MKVLDHGYVSLIETWGSDERIIESARMSTQKGFEGWGPKCVWCDKERGPSPDGFATRDIECVCGSFATVPGDEKLLAYLWKNHHATPFEMAGAIFEVQAPIFVFREWHRHRTQSYNEMSARYTPLPDVNYMPTMDRLMLNASKTNKQEGAVAGSEELTQENAASFLAELAASYGESQALYEVALKWGVPKELARVHLPVGRYSKMRASANLRNWLAFLTLRDHHAAQWEIRQYASAVCTTLAEKFPRTLTLFKESRA